MDAEADRTTRDAVPVAGTVGIPRVTYNLLRVREETCGSPLSKVLVAAILVDDRQGKRIDGPVGLGGRKQR